MERLPILSLHIEKMNFSISICIFTPNKKYFTVRDCQSWACPKRIFHSYRKNLPNIFINFIKFNTVINFLLGASEKASESVNTVISNRTCTKIVPFIFHRRYLCPFVLPDIIFFNWAKSLLSRKSSKDKHRPFAYSDSMGISALIHHGFV